MNVRELIESEGIQTAPSGHRHTRTGWVNVDCPFCGVSGKFHLGFNIRGGYASCWRCGYHTLRESLSELLGSQEYQRVSSFLEFEGFHKELILHKGQFRLPANERMKIAHLGYVMDKLKLTNIHDIEEIERLWGLRGIGRIPLNLAWSVLIPIYDKQSRMISWTTRSIYKDAQVRYRNAPSSQEAFPARDYLYGEQYCENWVIVHEGPTDVWRTGPGAVALMGAYPTSAQMYRLSLYAKRIICLDSDSQSWHNAEKLRDELAPFPGETWAVRLDSKDACEASNEEIYELRQLALV